MEEVILDDDEVKTPAPDFNIFVGAETGLLKGVCINPKSNICKNFSNMHSLERKHEITAMAWGNDEQTEILMGLKGQVVRTFDTEDKTFTSSHGLSINSGGKIVGIERVDETLVVAVESGTVQVWHDPKKEFNTIEHELHCSGKLKTGNFKDEEAKEKHMVALKVDRSLARLRKVPGSTNLIATGGKESDLQLWDLNKIDDGPVFRAKNVAMDSLELRVPVWITDFCFPDNASSDKIATVTRYGHVRLYDCKSGQRRPVMSIDWPDQVLTATASTPSSDEILVASASGQIAQFDIRMSHKGMRKKYRGCTGGIRSLKCHPTQNVFAAVGLDRFLRIYDVNQSKPIQKMYLKSKLNHVLISNSFDPSKDIVKEVPKPTEAKKKKKPVVEEDENESKGDGEEFWTKLPILRGTSKKGSKRGLVVSSAESKKKKAK